MRYGKQLYGRHIRVESIGFKTVILLLILVLELMSTVILRI